MSKYTQIPADTFKNLQLNAGIILSDFNVDDGSFKEADMLGATTGGSNFTATPTFADYGEDVDNCPANMKELKRLTAWEVKLTTTFVAVGPAAAKRLTGAADLSQSGRVSKVTPRNDLADADFSDVWWVGDYSDVTTGDNAGFVAVHVLNALSTTGFQIQSTDDGKGQFAAEFTGHYSMDAQDVPPFEVYLAGGTEATSSEEA